MSDVPVAMSDVRDLTDDVDLAMSDVRDLTDDVDLAMSDLTWRAIRAARAEQEVRSCDATGIEQA